MVSPAFATVGQTADGLLDPEHQLPHRYQGSSDTSPTSHTSTQSVWRSCHRRRPTSTGRNACTTRRTGMRSFKAVQAIKPRRQSTRNSQASPASSLAPLQRTCRPFNGGGQIRSDPASVVSLAMRRGHTDRESPGSECRRGSRCTLNARSLPEACSCPQAKHTPAPIKAPQGHLRPATNDSQETREGACEGRAGIGWDGPGGQPTGTATFYISPCWWPKHEQSQDDIGSGKESFTSSAAGCCWENH
ncbi:hypothetical protein B0T11DRAFT_126554 [Plectosphaerella cucumerina]|uniref:Uncharacterized protein n=1 Tax=Plectosphaerella cucumerina TaxID=40658 RepID=A0A8K0TF55_9PEZI|nr:hypothetical protein B0T11DRAFT_126554 [Plectosphaerella cucumerina]